MPGALAPRRYSWRLIPIAAAIAGLSTGAGVSFAGSGGGLTIPDPPQVSDVICTKDCAGLRKVAAGSQIEFTGKRLGTIEQVRFPGEDGIIKTKPVKVAKKRVVAQVPEGAVSGYPRLVDPVAGAAKPPKPIKIVTAIPKSEQFALRSAVATPRNSFFDARKKTALKYRFKGSGPTAIRIEVINRKSGETVRRLRREAEPNTENVAQWDGTLKSGKPAKEGKYSFRIGPVTGGAESDKNARFALRSHMFPVRAPHTFGDGYGAGRGHRGVDIFAKCGKPIVAARGGKVIYRAFQGSAAGHYIVISGKGTNRDYMYAHLARRSPLKPGTRVKTGQRIGRVGETGNASGCHLHFEVWKGAWYGGGKPITRIKPLVRKWDSWS